MKLRHRTPRSGLFLGVCLTIVTLSLTGCGLFQTREPSPGDDENKVQWIPPEAMYIALGNMKRSLEAKVLTNYGLSFSDVILEMIMDPADEGALGDNPFEVWSAREEEQRMRGILMATDASLVVTWTVGDSIQETPSDHYYEDLEYRLEFDLDGQLAIYTGLVDLWFHDSGDGLWHATRWIDKRDGSANHTWCWLRAVNKVEFPTP